MISAESHFIVVFLLFVVYIALGSYLYFCKILPGIDRAGGRGVPGLPSEQLRQIKEYVRLLDEKNERPWYYPFLRYNPQIAAVLFALWLWVLLRIAY